MNLRRAVVVVSLGLGLAAAAASGACSSDDKPACTVDGTYSVTGQVESGDCPTSDQPVTDTFKTLPNGRVQLVIQGLPDLSPVGTMNGCKWTAAGAITIIDDGGPLQQKGTLQYSYTFTETGLTGILSQSLPPETGLPNGCNGTTKVTGTRR